MRVIIMMEDIGTSGVMNRVIGQVGLGHMGERFARERSTDYHRAAELLASHLQRAIDIANALPGPSV